MIYKNVERIDDYTRNLDGERQLEQVDKLEHFYVQKNDDEFYHLVYSTEGAEWHKMGSIEVMSQMKQWMSSSEDDIYDIKYNDPKLQSMIKHVLSGEFYISEHS